MSFGKRGKGEGHPARDLLPPVEETAAPSTVRTTVTNPGGIDKGFIALAVGVVLVSGGAAIAAPSVLDMFGGQVRPIEQIVAGLDRTQAKIALAREAFPDNEGRAFMASLQKDFPADHDRLMTVLADEALTGGDRDTMLVELGKWSVEFVAPNLPAITRTGADGFDELLNITDGALTLVGNTAGCTAGELETFVQNPANLTKKVAYGSDAYKFSMTSSATMVKLIAKGRNAPPAPTDLRDEDQEAMMTLFIGMMADPQVMEIMKASSSGRRVNAEAAARNIDICKLGHSIVYKLRRLPHGTKERALGFAAKGIDKQGQLLRDIMSGKGGIPGVNAPPSGFPTHLLENGPAMGDLKRM